MAGYFNFRKTITTYFVRTIYALGFIVLTLAGLGLTVWAGQRLNTGILPTRTAVYFIAAGVGVTIIGNLMWRMLCEFWLLFFNMQALLVSIERSTRHPSDEPQTEHGGMEPATKRADPRERRTYGVASTRGVLGLS